MLHPDVVGRYVEDRRVARLQNPLGACRIRERHPSKDDLDALVRVLQRRRTRIIPHGLLARTGLYTLATHQQNLLDVRRRLYEYRRRATIRCFTTIRDQTDDLTLLFPAF